MAAVIGLINSGVACYYYLRLLSSIYTKPRSRVRDDFPPTPVVSVLAGIGLALAAAATLMLGILPGHVLHLANYASTSLRTISVPAPPDAPSVGSAPLSNQPQ